MLEDVDMDKAWRVALKDMPSRGGAEENTVMLPSGTVVQLRAVAAMDRRGAIIGPSLIISQNDITVSAMLDLITFDLLTFELIVLGENMPETADVGGMTYVSYKHVDSPNSKTATPHYRLYDPWSSINLGRTKLKLPVLFARMLRFAGPFYNVLEALPYAQDVERLIQHRPDLTQLTLRIITNILKGRAINFVDMSSLRREVSSPVELSMSSVFTNHTYKKTAFTDENHGKGPHWNRLYTEMFS